MQKALSAPHSELPFVMVNMAISADGKIATAGGEVHSFGSDYDTENLLKLRAQADAVMCGARTAEVEGVTLLPGGARYRKMRLRHGLSEYNLRVVVSGSGSINTGAKIFKVKQSPLIVITTEKIPKINLSKLEETGASVLVCGKDRIDFVQALKILKRDWKVNVLLSEGGGKLNASLFECGLVNRLYITICPFIFGGKDAPTIADGAGFKTLDSAVKLELKSLKRVGKELYLVYDVLPIH